MQITTYFTHSDVEHKLGEIFGFDYSGQDWDLVNANYSRVSEFISYFLKTDESKELIALFDLIIASIDDLSDLSEQEKQLAKIHEKLSRNISLFLNTLTYWSAIGSGSNHDQVWSVTPLIRKLLIEQTKTDNFEITCNEIYCIKPSNAELTDLISGKGLNVTFDELLTNLKTSNELKLNTETTLSVDFFGEFCFWSLYSTKGHYLFKFSKSEYLKEIGKNET